MPKTDGALRVSNKDNKVVVALDFASFGKYILQFYFLFKKNRRPGMGVAYGRRHLSLFPDIFDHFKQLDVKHFSNLLAKMITTLSTARYGLGLGLFLRNLEP